MGGKSLMNNNWSEVEDSLLLKLKQKKLSYKEILEFIPNHSQDSIRNRFWILNKARNTQFEKEARVLVLDIETSLMIFSAWRTGEQYLTDTNIINDWFMMSWAAKWLGEKETYSDVLTPKEAKNKNDRRIAKSMWELLNEADVVITHNGDGFDLKKLNTRFIYHRLGLPRPYKSVDTLKLARKMFSFSSNKLDYICKFLGLEAKSKHNGYETWLECLKGNKEALEMLVEYNRNDVVILEALYHQLKEGLVNPPKFKYGYKHDRQN